MRVVKILYPAVSCCRVLLFLPAVPSRLDSRSRTKNPTPCTRTRKAVLKMYLKPGFDRIRAVSSGLFAATSSSLAVFLLPSLATFARSNVVLDRGELLKASLATGILRIR